MEKHLSTSLRVGMNWDEKAKYVVHAGVVPYEEEKYDSYQWKTNSSMYSDNRSVRGRLCIFSKDRWPNRPREVKTPWKRSLSAGIVTSSIITQADRIRPNVPGHQGTEDNGQSNLQIDQSIAKLCWLYSIQQNFHLQRSHVLLQLL